MDDLEYDSFEVSGGVISYPAKVRWTCLRCTKSCRDTPGRTRQILLLETEAQEIAIHSGLALHQFCETAVGRGPYRYLMRKDANGRCIFLRGDACSIYRFRPLVCQFYPFSLHSVASGSYRFDFDASCSGFGVGRLVDRQFIKGLFELAKQKIEQSQRANDDSKRPAASPLKHSTTYKPRSR